jgi:hypothetical protein
MDNRQRILDWIPSYDEKSRAFRAVAGIEDKPLRSYTWTCDVVLDQGREGACVGFGWSHELCAKPKVYRVDNNFALEIYNRAKRLDQWYGENYEGTSVLAGAKAIMEKKNASGVPLIGSYHWAFGVEDIVRTIGYKGPVVLGINWYNNMYEPDENGHIWASGDLAGGHCILANAFRFRRINDEGPYTFANIDKQRSRIRVHNSWGPSWGIDGEGFIDIENLTKLMNVDGGEAAIPEQRVV